jgi:FeS assembly protein IscX
MLTWDAAYEMALALRDAHPDADLEQINTRQIYEWAIALPDFADDPAMVNEAMLVSILQEWYEETNGV